MTLPGFVEIGQVVRSTPTAAAAGEPFWAG